MDWIILIIAGIFEIIWAIGLKYSQGFTRLWPSLITITAMLASFVFLSRAIKTIPIGNAYAVWTGIGAAGVAVMGIFLFNDSTDIRRLLCIALIVTGIIGLKLLSSSATP